MLAGRGADRVTRGRAGAGCDRAEECERSKQRGWSTTQGHSPIIVIKSSARVKSALPGPFQLAGGCSRTAHLRRNQARNFAGSPSWRIAETAPVSGNIAACVRARS